MRLLPAQLKSAMNSPRAHALALAVTVVLAGSVGLRQAHAEPIALDPIDSEARTPAAGAGMAAPAGAASSDSAGELKAALRPAPVSDPADAANAASPFAGAATVTSAASAATAGNGVATKPAPDADARVPAPAAARTPTGNAPRGEPPRRPGSSTAANGDEAADEESDWERELKESVRPIYNELTTSGVVDAVQGFKSYLSMLGVIASGERNAQNGQRAGAEGRTEARSGSGEAAWETRAAPGDALALAHANAQVEKERMIAALIFEEWLAAAPPWLYGFAALFIAWQIGRLVFALLRTRSARAQRRAAKASRRSAANARTRARS